MHGWVLDCFLQLFRSESITLRTLESYQPVVKLGAQKMQTGTPCVVLTNLTSGHSDHVCKFVCELLQATEQTASSMKVMTGWGTLASHFPCLILQICPESCREAPCGTPHPSGLMSVVMGGQAPTWVECSRRIGLALCCVLQALWISHICYSCRWERWCHQQGNLLDTTDFSFSPVKSWQNVSLLSNNP